MYIHKHVSCPHIYTLQVGSAKRTRKTRLIIHLREGKDGTDQPGANVRGPSFRFYSFLCNGNLTHFWLIEKVLASILFCLQ